MIIRPYPSSYFSELVCYTRFLKKSTSSDVVEGSALLDELELPKSNGISSSTGNIFVEISSSGSSSTRVLRCSSSTGLVAAVNPSRTPSLVTTSFLGIYLLP